MINISYVGDCMVGLKYELAVSGGCLVGVVLWGVVGAEV